MGPLSPCPNLGVIACLKHPPAHCTATACKLGSLQACFAMCACTHARTHLCCSSMTTRPSLCQSLVNSALCVDTTRRARPHCTAEMASRRWPACVCVRVCVQIRA